MSKMVYYGLPGVTVDIEISVGEEYWFSAYCTLWIIPSFGYDRKISLGTDNIIKDGVRIWRFPSVGMSNGLNIRQPFAVIG